MHKSPSLFFDILVRFVRYHKVDASRSLSVVAALLRTTQRVMGCWLHW